MSIVAAAGIAAALYLCIVAGMFIFQRQLMYRPGSVLPAPTATMIPAAEGRITGTAPEGGAVSWYLPPKAGKPVVVYFQGNAGTIADRDYKAAPLAAAGYGVMLTGYRGYGGNPGAPNEAGLYADAQGAIAALASDGIDPAQIVLYGESLGTGIATQTAFALAAKGTPAAGLILEAPFSSMGAAAQRHYPFLPAKYLVRDRYDSAAKIAAISAPLMIVHGDADRVVDQAEGRRLFGLAAEPKQAHWIPGGGHSDLYDFGAGDLVLKFLADLRR